jgi:hypothetical protein
LVDATAPPARPITATPGVARADDWTLTLAKLVFAVEEACPGERTSPGTAIDCASAIAPFTVSAFDVA